MIVGQILLYIVLLSQFFFFLSELQTWVLFTFEGNIGKEESVEMRGFQGFGASLFWDDSGSGNLQREQKFGFFIKTDYELSKYVLTHVHIL